MTNEILSYNSALAFFKIWLSLSFEKLIAPASRVQTSEFHCTSAAWLGKVMFTQKEATILK